MKYRPEIDGLRGVAVALVVLYHLKLFSIEGGFMGVDLFFVISGYLIGSIVASEIDRGEFSLGNFYERRVRRIFPALFTVLLTSSIVSLVLLLPPDLTKFSRSLLAATFFFPNIFFASQESYFNPTSELQPLLHTWSLGVEEQFYMALPLLLLALTKIPGRIKAIVLLILPLISFTWSVSIVEIHPMNAFYLLPSRAWELLIGVGLTLFPTTKPKSRILRELASFAGLGCILGGAFFYRKPDVFPGYYALFPTVGAVLLLQSCTAGSSAIKWLLSTKPFVALGLLSYSLYLWHWPLLSFYIHSNGTIVTWEAKVLLLVSSLALSWVTWRFIEQPCRRPRSSHSRGSVFAAGTTLMLIAGLLGFFTVRANGFPSRFTPQIATIASVLDEDADVTQRRGVCFITADHGDFNLFNKELCLNRDPTKPNYLLLGDSHAAHYWKALRDELPEIQILQATASQCKPVLDTPGKSYCQQLMRFMFDSYLPDAKLDGVIIAGRWIEKHVPSLLATIEQLRKMVPNVYVIGPVVEYRGDVPRVLIEQIRQKDFTKLQKLRQSGQEKTDALLSAKLRELGVRYLSPYQLLCQQGQCKTVGSTGIPFQVDYGHFSQAGAVELVREWKGLGLLP